MEEEETWGRTGSSVSIHELYVPFGQENGDFKYTVGSRSILPERGWAAGTDVGAVSLQMTGSPGNG